MTCELTHTSKFQSAYDTKWLSINTDSFSINRFYKLPGAHRLLSTTANIDDTYWICTKMTCDVYVMTRILCTESEVQVSHKGSLKLRSLKNCVYLRTSLKQNDSKLKFHLMKWNLTNANFGNLSFHALIKKELLSFKIKHMNYRWHTAHISSVY